MPDLIQVVEKGSGEVHGIGCPDMPGERS